MVENRVVVDILISRQPVIFLPEGYKEVVARIVARVYLNHVFKFIGTFEKSSHAQRES